jgi:hypothetical protein
MAFEVYNIMIKIKVKRKFQHNHNNLPIFKYATHSTNCNFEGPLLTFSQI